MNSIANDTRQHRLATPTTAVHGRSLRMQARRLAAWWSADAQSIAFRGSIERDRGLLRRIDGR